MNVVTLVNNYVQSNVLSLYLFYIFNFVLKVLFHYGE